MIGACIAFQCANTNLDSDYPRGEFKALIIADTHINNLEMRDRKIKSFIEMVNKGAWPGVELVINLGDVVSSVYDEYDERHPELNVHRLSKADSLFELLELPYYLVMGNHDYKIHQTGSRKSTSIILWIFPIQRNRV